MSLHLSPVTRGAYICLDWGAYICSEHGPDTFVYAR